MSLDQKYHVMFRDTVVREFRTIEAFETWITLHIPDENVANIVRPNLLFDEKVADFIRWFNAQSRATEVLQKMADDPPNGSRALPDFIYIATLGEVKAAVKRQAGIKPITPCDDWFVVSRPFANRKKLRDDLKVFDQAPSGPESVLVIEGDRFSGKSHSFLFAIQCAPQNRYVAVDIGEWGETPMTAEDLAKAIGGYKGGADFPSFDITKEESAVPRLLTWLNERLKGTKTWVIVDHCNRPALTSAANALLARLAANIEKGVLRDVKLIVADIDRAKLPGTLPHRSRHDRAVLPDEAAVGHWVESFATHLNKTVTPQQISDFVSEVFEGIKMLIGPPPPPTPGQPVLAAQPAQPGAAAQPAAVQPLAGVGLQVEDDDSLTIDQAAVILEQRLLKVSTDIQAL
jgi:hypothetical protein